MISENLIEEAKKARQMAYAPYSHFKVGAALLTKSGAIYTGCNVENASYGLTICAERTALFKAVSAGEREFTALAVVTDLEDPASPCGACRQTLSEFAYRMPVILANTNGKVVETSLAELLPRAFSESSLIGGKTT